MSKLLSSIFTLVLLALPTWAQQSSQYEGVWDVSLGATVSITDDRRQIDPMTEQRTTTTIIGSGTGDQGTLEVNPNGTYTLRFWEYEVVYGAPLIQGQWRAVSASDPFADRQAIELLQAKPTPAAAPEDRKWYVFRTEKGEVEARYPPYDAYARIVLSRRGTAKSPAAPNQSAGTTQPAKQNASTAQPKQPSSGTTAPKSFTPDQVRAALTGKTLEQVQSVLGAPVKEAYGTYYWNGVEKFFPPAGSGNWKSFAIQFGGPGQTANSIELQYWTVE